MRIHAGTVALSPLTLIDNSPLGACGFALPLRPMLCYDAPWHNGVWCGKVVLVAELWWLSSIRDYGLSFAELFNSALSLAPLPRCGCATPGDFPYGKLAAMARVKRLPAVFPGCCSQLSAFPSPALPVME